MKAPLDCTSMAEIRAEIDRLDTDLVHLFAHRAGYIDPAAEIKAEVALPARIDARVEEVVQNVRRHAETYGLPPELVENPGPGVTCAAHAPEENRRGPAYRRRA